MEKMLGVQYGASTFDFNIFGKLLFNMFWGFSIPQAAMERNGDSQPTIVLQRQIHGKDIWDDFFTLQVGPRPRSASDIASVSVLMLLLMTLMMLLLSLLFSFCVGYVPVIQTVKTLRMIPKQNDLNMKTAKWSPTFRKNLTF